MRRWFLSYNSQDLPLVQGFEAALRRKDPEAIVFFAPKNLRAGGYWLPQLAEEIAHATAVVLLVGERGLGPWQVDEYYEARDRRVPVVLVLLEGQPAPGLPFLRQLHWIVTAQPQSEETVGRLIASTETDATRPEALWRFVAPYRGLAAMTEADSDFFFGRAPETVQTLEAIEAMPDRIPMLFGNSGVGKSSMAQAGVLAALKRQAWPEAAGQARGWPVVFEDSRHWCFLRLSPGTEPLRALVQAFLRTWQIEATDPLWERRQAEWVGAMLDGGATIRGLMDATGRRYAELGQSSPPAFFLYVDQAEELYVRAEERQRRRFSELLAAGVDDERLRALMSLRSDFLGALQNDEPLYTAHCQINVPPLREAELFEVVNRPAEALSARFETEGLAGDIARRAAEESAKDAGALPLLSYLLDDMWTQMVKRDDGLLRLPAQAVELGGVLASRADAFLARYPKAEDRLRRIFTLKLATVREDGEPSRRRALRSEFTDEEWRLVCELADHPHRLLVTAAPEDGDVYAEVAHEAIFRRWNRLRQWIASEREFIAWKSGLESARRSWQQTPASSRNDALLMGLALAQAQSWFATRGEDLPQFDREFIEHSLRRDALERQQRESLRRRVLVVAVGALAMVSVLAGFSYVQWRAAAKERDRAEQALADVPKSALAYIGRGLAYYLKGDYDRAIQDFDEGIKLDPNNMNGYFSRGVSYQAKKDYDRAIADLDQAIKLDPANALNYGSRADCYNEKGQYDLAMADYDQALMLNHNYAYAYKGRGQLYRRKGNYDAAIADYNQAVKLDPRDAVAVNDRGVVYENKGELDRALADYAEAIRLNPKYALAFTNRGYIYSLQGNNDRAIADYDEAIRLDPKVARPYLNRGYVYFERDDLDRTIADDNEAIRIDPKFVLAYSNRGYAYFIKGDVDRASADYNEALRLDPQFSAGYFNRGLLNFNVGALSQALADLDRAIALNPKYAYGWLLLDILGRHSNASSRLMQAVAQADMTRWPAPAIRLFLGELSPEALHAAAANPRSDIQQQQICEADFFSAELALQKGAKPEAASQFRHVVADCPRHLSVRAIANAELKMLGQTQ